jgi:hypothetical protein
LSLVAVLVVDVLRVSDLAVAVQADIRQVQPLQSLEVSQ